MGRNHQLDTVYDIAVFQGRMWQTCNAQVYRSMLTADYPQARSKSEVVTTSVICGGLNWIISFLTRAWNEHKARQAACLEDEISFSYMAYWGFQ